MRAGLSRYAIPLFFLALCAMSFTSDTYSQYLINLMLAYVIIALGLNFIVGYAGMFAFAHAAFMGIGAYASGLLTVKLQVPFLLALPAAGILTGLVGCAVGIPAIRVSGLYLAMVTMAFAEFVQWVFRHWKPVTGGADGISIPAPVIMGHAFRGELATFYIIATVAFLMTILAMYIVRSRLGRAFVAVRDSEIAARCNSIDVARTKTIAFGLSAFYAGIGGSIFSLTQHYIAPENFGLFQTILHFCIVIVGGAASIAGSIIGSVVLTALPEVLRNVQALQEIGYGLLLIVFVIFAPRGIAGWLKDIGILQREQFFGRRLRPGSNGGS